MKGVPFRREAGLTRADTVIAFTLISVTVLSLYPLLIQRRGGTTSIDVRTVLSGNARRAFQVLQKDLSSARRVFARGPSGSAFLSLIDAPSSPPPLPGAKLPALRGDDPPSGGKDPAAGNSLFYVFAGKTERFPGLLNGEGRPASPRVDILTFEWVFPALRPDARIGGKQARDLWDWRSIPYADAATLFAMTDATLRNNLIAALSAQGITNAFDVTASTAGAFFTLSPVPPWIFPSPDRRIRGKPAVSLTGPPRGAPPATFVHSLSPNTDGTFSHAHPVPAWALADEDFPSGFETRFWGQPGNLRVSARIVLAAEGDFKGVGSYETVLTTPVSGGKAR